MAREEDSAKSRGPTANGARASELQGAVASLTSFLPQNSRIRANGLQRGGQLFERRNLPRFDGTIERDVVLNEDSLSRLLHAVAVLRGLLFGFPDELEHALRCRPK